MKQIINNNSSLFSNFIKNSIKAPSPKVQQNFMKVTSELVEVIKKILETEKLIFDVSYEGKKYWENAKKHKFAFVDGGAFSSFLSSTAPFAIRANTYIVKPDELLEKRELFRETVKFVGDLYDPDRNLYDLDEDPYEDNQ